MSKRIFLITAIVLCTALRSFAAPAEWEKSSYETKAGKYRVVSATNCKNAVAKVGEEVKLRVVVESEDPGFAAANLFVNGVRQGKRKLVKLGTPVEFAVTPTEPGSVSVICSVLDENRKFVRNARKRKVEFGVGVLVNPNKIAPGNPKCPDDFDAFWQRKRAELDKVPVKAVRKETKLSPEEEKKYPGVVCYDVKVDCAGSAKVSGYLCMPRDAKPRSLPAIVIYHGAGVRSSNKQLRYGTKAIAFDVNAHGIENGKNAEFYNELGSGRLKNYRTENFDDHNNIYFVGMYMRVMRALDYVKSLPEWNGKTLIAFGTSQGGGQTIAAAALDPQVTLAVAGVPALCDLGGRQLKRQPGWPVYLMPPERQSDVKIIGESAYIDGVFFARRIKCPVYISTGLIDNVCHAAAVHAAFNALPAGTRKRLHVNPVGAHNTSPNRPGLKEIDRQLGFGKTK